MVLIKRKTSSILLAILAVMLLATALPPVESAHAEAKSSRASKPTMRPLGISTGSVPIYYDVPTLRKYFSHMRALGVKRIRVDFSWPSIQPEKNVWNWGTTDTFVAEARRANIQILGILDYEPAWAKRYSSSGKLLPPSPAMFANFSKQVALRYRGKVRAWEIWNEPNLVGFWPSGPDGKAYGRLARETAKTLRKANPKAKILVGAMSPANNVAGEQIHPLTFLKDIYATVPRGLFDAVSVHPYTYPGSPTGQEEWNTFYRMNAMHSFMKSKKDGKKKLWLTEYGAPTGNGEAAVSEERQAELIIAGLEQARRKSFVGPIYIYSLRDTGTDSYDREQNFGLLTESWKPKKAYWALKQYVAQHR